MRAFLVGLVLLSSLGASAVASAATYTSEELGFGTPRQYVDLNNNQYALTMRQDAAGLQNYHIVIENLNPGYYSETRPGTLPGTTRAIALDFNDSQATVGYAETLDASGTATAPERAFVYSNGTFTDLSALAPLNAAGNKGSRALSINNLGDVLGFWRDPSGVAHSFLYSGGTLTDLGNFNSDSSPQPVAINDSKQLTGTQRAPAITQQTSPHAFLYSAGSIVDIDAAPYGLGSYGLKINARGDIVGTSRPGTHSQRCFMYSGGAVTNFATVGSSPEECSSVSSLNNLGAAVGSVQNYGRLPTNFTYVGYVFSNGHTTDLNTLLSPTDNLVVNKIWVGDALAINDSGYIIAKGGNGRPYLLKPDTATQPTDNAYYHFEYTQHNWYSEGDPIVSLTSANDQRFAGVASLGVHFNGSGYVSVGTMYPPSLAGKTVTFHVYLPADATIEWVQPFVLEDYDGNWAWHGNWQPVGDLQLGAWNTITVEVPANAQGIYRIGVELFTSQTYGGTVYIDSVSF